jgi:hypothetical protein
MRNPRSPVLRPTPFDICAWREGGDGTDLSFRIAYGAPGPNAVASTLVRHNPLCDAAARDRVIGGGRRRQAGVVPGRLSREVA